jgi:hypothetical protein
MRHVKLPRAGGQKRLLDTLSPFVSMGRMEGTTTVLRLR